MPDYSLTSPDSCPKDWVHLNVLCPADPTVDFVQNLRCFIGDENPRHKVVKFVTYTGFDGRSRDSALDELDRMNINGVNLFPGLGGFAESFEAMIPFFLKQPRR